LLKRPKKIDVYKMLKFHNGIMVPSTKTEKEAVRMGREVDHDVSKGAETTKNVNLKKMEMSKHASL